MAVGSVIALLVVSPWAAAGVAAVLLVAGAYIVWRVHRRIRRALAWFRERRLRAV